MWSPNGKMITLTSDRSSQSQMWLMTKDGRNQRQLSRGPAVHAWPQWHPNGKSLVTWSFDPATASHRITTIDVSRGKEQILVESKEMLDRPVPGFSSKRQVVAYAAQSNGNWDIWLVEVAKGKPRRLASEAQMESNPLWSNDGKMLGYKVATATGACNLTGQYFMRFGKDYTVPNTYK